MISDDELDRRLRDAFGAVAATVSARSAAHPSSMTAPTADAAAAPPSRSADLSRPNTREHVPRLPAPRSGRGWALPASLAAVVAVIAVTVALVATTSSPDAPTQPGAPGSPTPATNQTVTSTATVSSEGGASGRGQTVQPGQPPADGTTTTKTTTTTTVPTSTSPGSRKVPTSSTASP